MPIEVYLNGEVGHSMKCKLLGSLVMFFLTVTASANDCAAEAQPGALSWQTSTMLSAVASASTQTCLLSSDNAEANEGYIKYFGNGALLTSGTVAGVVLSGTSRELEIARLMVGNSSPQSWAISSNGCTTVVCALSKTYGSQEAAQRALTIAERSGYILGLNPIHANTTVKWESGSVRAIDKALVKLGARFWHLPTLGSFVAIDSGIDSNVAGNHGGGMAEWDMKKPGTITLYTPINERTVLHEMGHHFDFTLTRDVNISFGSLMETEAGPEFLSEYSMTNPQEDFAENFATYFDDPMFAKIASPKKYEFIQKYFQIQSIPALPGWPALEAQLDQSVVASLISSCLEHIHRRVGFVASIGKQSFMKFFVKNDSSQQEVMTDDYELILNSECLNSTSTALAVKLQIEKDYCERKGSEGIRSALGETIKPQLYSLLIKLAQYLKSFKPPSPVTADIAELKQAMLGCIQSQKVSTKCPAGRVVSSAIEADPAFDRFSIKQKKAFAVALLGILKQQ